jgi:hypothetical protein
MHHAEEYPYTIVTSTHSLSRTYGLRQSFVAFSLSELFAPRLSYHPSSSPLWFGRQLPILHTSPFSPVTNFVIAMDSSPLVYGILFSLFIASAILAVLLFTPGIQQSTRESHRPLTSVQQKQALPSQSTPDSATATSIRKDETTSDDGQGKPTTATGIEKEPLTESYRARSHAQPTCFRISGIPSDWDRNKLEQNLRDIDPDLDLMRDELSELFPACGDSTQTALLNLERCTAFFQKFKQNDEISKVLPETSRKIQLMFDKHFYDLTPMNRPATPIIAELVPSLQIVFII